MTSNEINLNNFKWQVKGFWPYVPLFGKSIETGKELMGVTEWIDAVVPGGVHHDLLKAGIIEDPYFELNSLKCEWVENRWWLYKTTFNISEELKGKKLTLIFKGVDYKAHFNFNKLKLGEHEGMFEQVCFDISDIVKFNDDNLLEVLFESVPEEMSQIGYTSRTRTQKSRFSYKWDWCTRLVNIGFWDDIIIRITEDLVIDETYITTNISDGAGIVNVLSVIKGESGRNCTAKLTLFDGDNLLELIDEIFYVKTDTMFELKKSFMVKNPKLWYPNGLGGQFLYKLSLQIYQDGKLSDEKVFHVGIRKLEYRRNYDSSEQSLPYTVVINGDPVYIKGVNLTPFDQLYGTVTCEVYERYIRLLKLANINLVRVNGVGIIEKECFYELCDKNGIMVWQDFIQSSSGIENVPSVDPGFLKLLEKTVIHTAKEKRNHVSLVIWCGGNELTDINKVPITYEHSNIRRIKELLDIYDPCRLFLPSTSSGPIFELDINQLGLNHDVHGSWKYEGVENHYKLYNKSDSLFHSEFGVDGMSGISSLKKFMSNENIKLTNMTENLTWRHHGEWWDTFSREKELFGEIESLDDFVKASQFIQAEGIRYILEANRRRKYKNSGSIIWQFNEAWPNVSGTYLVDYYRKPKMAYYWVKNAYAAVMTSLKHDGLVQMPNSDFAGEIFLSNSGDESMFTVLFQVLDMEGKDLFNERSNVQIDRNSSIKVKDISFNIPQCKDSVFFIRLKAYSADGTEVSHNLYIFSQKTSEFFEMLRNKNKNALTVEKNENGYSIKNKDCRVCLFVHGEDRYDKCIYIRNNFISLFPGEEALFSVESLDGFDFDSMNREIIFDYL